MKHFSKLIVGGLLLAIAGNASAVMISEVGTQDRLVAQTTLANSSEHTERDWIESVLGFEVQYLQLSDAASEGANWESVQNEDGSVRAGDYAFDLGGGFVSTHYLLRVGNGNGNGVEDSHYLFQNEDSLRWAFTNLSVFGPNVALDNVTVISHVGMSVPEIDAAGAPLALALLGSIVAIRRERRQNR